MLFDGAHPVSGFPALAGLPWHGDPGTAYRVARSLLTGMDRPSDAVATYLTSLDAAATEYLLDRSTERNTHVKWCLGGRRRDYLVWLHQYKTPDEFAAADAFAASIHDHRYGFASLVVSGHLDVTWFAVHDGVPSPVEQRRLVAADVVTLTPDDVHCIDAVGADTVTLVIEGPPVRRFSTVYRRNGRAPSTKPDLEAILPRLVRTLSGVGQRPGPATH